jgi:hypothetical protein
MSTETKPEPQYIAALRERLAVCESEHEAWERVYREAEAEMRKKLEGYHQHYDEMNRLKRALGVLAPPLRPPAGAFDGSRGT